MMEQHTRFDNASIDQDVQRTIDWIRKNATNPRVCLFVVGMAPLTDNDSGEVEIFCVSLYRGTPPTIATRFVNAALDLLEDGIGSYMQSLWEDMQRGD